jgi:DNA-binding PadR family transcriptional regulator
MSCSAARSATSSRSISGRDGGGKVRARRGPAHRGDELLESGGGVHLDQTDGPGRGDVLCVGHTGQSRFYAGAASKIYEQPRRLERLGYLRSEKRPGKTREKTYNTLTETGLAALREWLERPSTFPRIQSEVAARVLASDLALAERDVVGSLQALREEIGALAAQIDLDERRALSIPHRERQLRLVRSLGRKLLQAHLEWIDEVERELGERPSPGPARR